METSLINQIILIRTLVGYLGEKEQFGWWQSSFFTYGSDAFLSPIFGRTKFLAQCNGVKEAATLVHDEKIGVGNVYHLFRLPEEIEQRIHDLLNDPDVVSMIQKNIVNKEDAISSLQKQSDETQNSSVGPIRIGKIQNMNEMHLWRQVAGCYLFAYKNNSIIFPYFSL
jgi:hypothetical protein